MVAGALTFDMDLTPEIKVRVYLSVSLQSLQHTLLTAGCLSDTIGEVGFSRVAAGYRYELPAHKRHAVLGQENIGPNHAEYQGWC